MVKTANSFVLLCEEQKKRSAKDKDHAAAVQARRALLQKLAAELAPRRRAVVAQAWLGSGSGLGLGGG